MGVMLLKLISHYIAGRVPMFWWNTKAELFLIVLLNLHMGFPGGSVVKNLPASAGAAGDRHSVPGLGRSSGGRDGNPVQDSCLENSMDRGASRLQSMES